MSKIAVITMARTASTRLPNKVIFDLGGKPAFIHVIERITSVIDPDYLLVACDENACDDPIELFAKHYGIDCFRGAEDSRRRVRAAGRKAGLKGDDVLLTIAGDTPLGVYKHIPYLIERMDEYDCKFSFADIPQGSLIWALHHMCEVNSFGSQAEFDQNVHIVEHRHLGVDPFYSRDCRRMIRLKFPPEYLVSWPWGPLYLDWPSQACVIKEIYRQLYKGSPIDEFDVYNLMKQQPYLANIIPLEFPSHATRGNGVRSARSTRELFFEQFKLLGAEVIELTWGGE